MKLVSHPRLCELLHYDPDLGIFWWLVRNSQRAIEGSVAGAVSNGYILIGVDGVRYKAHRLAWFYVHGVWPEEQIDHINGNRSDNRITNLRESTNAKNQQNIWLPKSHNKLGLLGVSKAYNGNGFYARLVVNGVAVFCRYFASAQDAHAAYMAAKRKYHPSNHIGECNAE